MTYCPAHLPGVCSRERMLHDCALPAGHRGPHECFEGHEWADEKEVVA